MSLTITPEKRQNAPESRAGELTLPHICFQELITYSSRQEAEKKKKNPVLVVLE